MSSIPDMINDLPKLACPLLEQISPEMCIGDMVWLLAYNSMVLERSIVNNISPAGIVKWYAGELSTIPAGHILCDGTAYQRKAFPILFEAIGSLYVKESDAANSLSANCFRVPDLLGRNIIGADLNKRGADEHFNRNNWKHYPHILNTFVPLNGPNNNGSGGYRGFEYVESNMPPAVGNSAMTQIQLVPIITTGEVCA